MDQLVSEARDHFWRRFAREPRYVVAAPGRVNLIGDHVDYNGGFVLPMALDRQTVIVADPTEDGSTADRPSTVYTSQLDDLQTVVPLHTPPDQPHWTRYVQGVVDLFTREIEPPPAFDAVIHSNVPLGGGLSSSAALEVAVATLLEQLVGRILEPTTKALLCQRAEHESVGVPCGIMDQFTAVLAQEDHFMLLDCRSQQWQMVRLPDPQVVVMVVDTQVTHELAAGEYADRRRQCELAAHELSVASLRDISATTLETNRNRLDPTIYRRARHVVSENARTSRVAEAIEAGHWQEVGQLMFASHASLRDDYEVSCPELDELVAAAVDLADQGVVFGARMTGGGFGGSTVNLVPAATAAQVADTLCTRFRDKFGSEALSFVARPSGGARVLLSPPR